MPRPLCLFTGQWADLPLETLAAKAKAFGYDGLELACWGDHFDVQRALAEKDYAKKKWELLADHGLASYAISNHLVGQAVCDRIDARHKAILPKHVWGKGDAEGVQKRAAQDGQGRAEVLRRRAEAREGAPREEDEAHRRRRLHGLVDLAVRVLVPAEPPEHGRRGI